MQDMRSCEICRASTVKRRAILDGHPLVQCRSCHLVFLDKASGLGGNGHGDYYDDVGYEQWAACYRDFKLREFRMIAARLRSLGAAGALLDVGCSYGWFLEEALRAGFDARGIEPSASLVRAIADASLRSRIAIGGVETLNQITDQFQVISLLDVLEHVSRPREALQAVKQRLAPGGIVVIRVPDVDGLIHQAALWGYAWSGGRLRTPLEALAQIDNAYGHLFFFNARTLRRLLEDTGFQPLDQSSSDIFDARRVSQRVALSGSSHRYERWNHPLIGRGIGMLQTAGRWLGRQDALVVYAQAR